MSVNNGKKEQKIKKQLFSNPFAYADDYASELCRNEKGRLREKVRYVGPWFKVLDDAPVRKRLVFLSAAFTLFSVAVTVILQRGSRFGSATGFVSVPVAAALLPAFYLITGAFQLPYAEKPLERSAYFHGVIRACRASVVLALFLFIAFAASLAVVLNGTVEQPSTGEWLRLSLNFLAVWSSAAVMLLLRKLDIREFPNEAFPAD